MKKFRSRQRIKNLLYSLPILIVLAIIAFFLAKGAWSVVGKERESARTLAGLEEGNEALKLRQAELRGKIEGLNTEEGIVQEIRAKFNAAREGEHLAVIVDDEQPATTTEKGLERLKKSWLKFLNFWRFW